MGNLLEKSTSKYILNKSNINNLETQLFEFCGLPKKDILSFDIEIGTYKDVPVYMRTLIIGDQKKPMLVLIHGYASSGSMFYKLFKGLTEHFCVICPDLIGMGASSRPDNYKRRQFTPQDSIDYFIFFLEEWRKNLELREFYLVAHSMGGYFAGNYALKYPQYIKKLILLSPIGVRVPPSDEKQHQRGNN